MNRLLRIAVVALLAAIAAPAAAQIPVDFSPGRSILTRDDLTRLLGEYEAAMASPAYSAGLKALARANADRVRQRLELGDFRPGDRVVLFVEGEANLPDTVAVEVGPKISLPMFGDISLRGVLRSEITDHLTSELGRIIRDPVVRAQGLMRLSIQGTVRGPGFYLVPADILVTEALMVAGGPSPVSDLRGIYIERGASRLLDGAELQDAMVQGLSLDQLNLQAGDQIVLPQKKPSILSAVARYAALIGSAVFLGIRIF